MSQKLVCTAELDLPDDALEAAKGQTALLEFWKQFTEALPENNLSGVRVDARIIKSKPKGGKADAAPATQLGGGASGQIGGGEKQAPEMPGFLKRT